MRVLILTLGSRGDVEPFAALGAALGARGVEVHLATSAGMAEATAGSGIHFHPFRVDFMKLAQSSEGQAAMRSARGKWAMWRQIGPMLETLLEDCFRVAQAVRPDVMVFHPKVTAGAHLAEWLGVPAFVALPLPMLTPTREFPTPLLPWPNAGAWTNRVSHRLMLWVTSQVGRSITQQWRSNALKLPPRLHDPLQGLPRLHAFSRALVPKPADWGSTDHVTGYWHHRVPASGDRLPPELEAFLGDGPPPIYIGFGSITGEAARLTAVVEKALHQIGCRAVVAAGWGGLNVRPIPGRVFVVAAVRHDLLFPHVSAVVHHGGSGTTHQGLRWGRPTLICPVLADQPFWGRRVAAAGAGPLPVHQTRLTAELLAQRLQELLENKAYALRAAELGGQMQREDGANAAAEIVAASAQGDAPLG